MALAAAAVTAAAAAAATAAALAGHARSCAYVSIHVYVAGEMSRDCGRP